MNTSYVCDEGDFSSENERAAIHHCDITGHRLTRQTNFKALPIVIEKLKEPD